MNARRAVFLALLFIPLSLGAGEADIVKYRQSLMKAMGAYMNALTAISKGTVPFRGDIASHARAVREIAHQMPSMFPKGTGPDKIPTDALPTVWTKSADFAAAAKLLEAESVRMEALAKTQDAKAIATQLDAMKKSCSTCHDDFRADD